MLTDQIILGQDDSGTQLLYVIAVIILAVGGAIVEKLKSKSAEAERAQRPRTPPVLRPPVARPPLVQTPRPVERPKPPPMVRPMPAAQRSPVQRPQLAQRPRREPETTRRPQVAPPTRPLAAPVGSEQAVGELQCETDSVARQLVTLEPVKSLAQLRAVRQAEGAPPINPETFRKLTIADLRRAIVLNEILGLPLALREDT